MINEFNKTPVYRFIVPSDLARFCCVLYTYRTQQCNRTLFRWSCLFWRHSYCCKAFQSQKSAGLQSSELHGG